MHSAFGLKVAAVLAASTTMMSAHGDQATSSNAAPSPGLFVPPINQRAKCVGVDEADYRQSLTLESRWLLSESRTALIILEDSSGSLKSGEWLENQSLIYHDGDRKHGITQTWDGTSFSKHIGSQYVRINLQEVGIDSASILYVSRSFSNRDLTGERFSNRGTIVLAGHCTLYVGGEKRTIENMPKLGRTM